MTGTLGSATREAPPVCANCGKRPGTENWVGDTGMLGLTHGWGKPWCEVCVLEAQIQRAKERAALLPELEARLAELLKPTTDLAEIRLRVAQAQPVDGDRSRVERAVTLDEASVWLEYLLRRYDGLAAVGRQLKEGLGRMSPFYRDQTLAGHPCRSCGATDALDKCSGNVSATAQYLGVHRSTVYRLMDRYQIVTFLNVARP